MKVCVTILLLVIGGMVIFAINNTQNCIKHNGTAFVELASETPFDAQTLGEGVYRNHIRIRKFFSSCY